MMGTYMDNTTGVTSASQATLAEKAGLPSVAPKSEGWNDPRSEGGRAAGSAGETLARGVPLGEVTPDDLREAMGFDPASNREHKPRVNEGRGI